MIMKNIIILILFIGTTLSSYNGFAQDLGCGTMVTAQMAQKIINDRSNRPLNMSYDSSDPVSVQPHIVTKSDGSGGMDSNIINSLKNKLDTHFSGTGISFNFCPVMEIRSDTYHAINTSGTQEEINMGLYFNEANKINIYFLPNVHTSWAKFPWDSYDWIIMKNSMASNASTISHEMGHYFGLLHTHDNGNGNEWVSRSGGDCSNCEKAGDGFCDTAADPNPKLLPINPITGKNYTLSQYVDDKCKVSGIPINDACSIPYKTSGNNLMSYSLKPCRSFLSGSQIKEILYFRKNGRHKLVSGCIGDDVGNCKEDNCGEPCQPCHCMDKTKSGDEMGEDCGGSCNLPCDPPRGPQPFECGSACESDLRITCETMTVEDIDGAITLSNFKVQNGSATKVNHVEIEYWLIDQNGDEIFLNPYISDDTGQGYGDPKIIKEIEAGETVNKSGAIYTLAEVSGVYTLRIQLSENYNSCLSSPFGIRYSPAPPSSGDCPANIYVKGYHTDLEARDYILAPSPEGSVTITQSQNSTFNAGKYIDLKPGFTAEYKSRFYAFIDGCGGISEPKINNPNTGLVLRNYPNPFTGETTIEFELLSEKPVTLFVTDMIGKKVATLLNNEQLSKGIQTTTFNGKDHPSGMYYYTLQMGDNLGTQKMILMK